LSLWGKAIVVCRLNIDALKRECRAMAQTVVRATTAEVQREHG